MLVEHRYVVRRLANVDHIGRGPVLNVWMSQYGFPDGSVNIDPVDDRIRTAEVVAKGLPGLDVHPKWITVISNFLFRATQKINILNFGGKIMNIYDFNVKNIKGEEVSLADYKGKVVLIVNTASKCGFTPQYEGLEALYKKYKDQGLIILGFPSNQFLAQEPGSAEEVQSFCKLNFGVTFPLFAKTDVRGKSAAPLFTYFLKASVWIAWVWRQFRRRRAGLSR